MQERGGISAEWRATRNVLLMLVIASGCAPESNSQEEVVLDTLEPKASVVLPTETPILPTHTPVTEENNQQTEAIYQEVLTPRLVGEVETADGKSEVFFLDTVFLNNQEVKVYYSKADIRDSSLKQTMPEKGEEWYNTTIIDNLAVQYIKPNQMYDLNLNRDLPLILKRLQDIYKDVNFSQSDVGGVYTSHDNLNNGVFCHDEDGSIGDYAACLAQTIDGDVVILLSQIVQPYVPPTTGGDGDGDGCPAGEHLSNNHCCPTDRYWDNDIGACVKQGDH